MSDETRLILEELGKLGVKIDNLNGKIDVEVCRLEAKIDTEIGRLEAKIDRLDEKIDAEVGRLEAKIDRLDEKIDTEIGRLETKIDLLQEEMQLTRLQIENEIIPNIRRIAEGHLDLSRNLHEAMKPSNEVEMLSIRVTMLESQVKEIEQKIS